MSNKELSIERSQDIEVGDWFVRYSPASIKGDEELETTRKMWEDQSGFETILSVKDDGIFIIFIQQ